jgi:hypothetical protein
MIIPVVICYPVVWEEGKDQEEGAISTTGLMHACTELS